MSDILEDFSRQFSSSLITAYERFGENQIEPGDVRELNSALIFAALEACRELCGRSKKVPEDQIWCRFTLGKVSDEKMSHVREKLKAVRLLNPTLKETPPATMSEFVFDFSFSSMNIDRDFASVDPDPPRPFEFLMIGESELAHSVDEIMKDLLRLVAASSPLKVMVYNNWKSNLNLDQQMTKVLERCCPKGGYLKWTPLVGQEEREIKI